MQCASRVNLSAKIFARNLFHGYETRRPDLVSDYLTRNIIIYIPPPATGSGTQLQTTKRNATAPAPRRSRSLGIVNVRRQSAFREAEAMTPWEASSRAHAMANTYRPQTYKGAPQSCTPHTPKNTTTGATCSSSQILSSFWRYVSAPGLRFTCIPGCEGGPVAARHGRGPTFTAVNEPTTPTSPGNPGRACAIDYRATPSSSRLSVWITKTKKKKQTCREIEEGGCTCVEDLAAFFHIQLAKVNSCENCLTLQLTHAESPVAHVIINRRPTTGDPKNEN